MYKEKITLEIEDDLIACLGLGVANDKKAKIEILENYIYVERTEFSENYKTRKNVERNI